VLAWDDLAIMPKQVETIPSNKQLQTW